MRLRSVRDRLFAVIASMAVIASLSIAGSYLVTESQRVDALADERVADELQGLTTELATAIRAQEIALDGFVYGGDPDALADYRAAVTEQLQLEERIRVMSVEVVDLDRHLSTLHDSTEAWRRTFADPTIGAGRGGSLSEVPARARASADDRTASQAAIEQMIGDIEVADSAVEARRDEIARDRATWSLIGVAVMFVVALVSVFLLRRWVTRPLDALLRTATSLKAGERVSFVRQRDDEIGHLGEALEDMRVSLQDDSARSNVLNRFTEATAFSPDDRQVASSALEALEMLVHPDAAVTHVLNRSKDRAVPEASTGGAHAEVLPLNALSRCPGIVRGSVYVTSDVSQPLSVHCPVYSLEAGTLACVPLAHGEVVGSVHLAWSTPHAFPLEDRASVARIAEHAALAIANRRLLAALQGMASTDARTGLANTRTFDKALEDALMARSDDETLAVLMIDLDHFKDFNDRYGHPAGDEALRAFSDILRSSIREEDLAARYGGEEFTVLLPKVDIETAMRVAERIRSRTESTIVNLGPGITDRISVSIGMATAPVQATDRLTLLRIADEALYRAKEAGRNRVEVYGREDPQTTAQTLAVSRDGHRPRRARKDTRVSAAG